MFRLEILNEVSDVNPKEIERVLAEANELLAITVASIKTIRKK